MSTDYRALCAELVELSAPTDSIPQLAERLEKLSELASRARAALAQPEPGVLTRPDCFNFSMDFLGGTDEVEMLNYIEKLESAARAALAQPEPVAPPMPVPGDAEGLAEVFWNRYDQPEPVAPTDDALDELYFDNDAGRVASWRQFARAVLARWGTPAAQPVPVIERLPGPEECTAQGWCWVLYRSFATWTLEPPLGQDGKHTGYTHWLPHWALPVPANTINREDYE
jgi:hypothetical protein